eukprot:6460470-Amphidinium_carterae.1
MSCACGDRRAYEATVCMSAFFASVVCVLWFHVCATPCTNDNLHHTKVNVKYAPLKKSGQRKQFRPPMPFKTKEKH